MARVTVDIPGLTAVGRRAGGYPEKVTAAKTSVDGAGAGVTPGSGLGSASTLARVEEVWSAHLRDLRTDLDAVGENLVATARTYRGHDDSSADYFQAVSPADRHHDGVRP